MLGSITTCCQVWQQHPAEFQNAHGCLVVFWQQGRTNRWVSTHTQCNNRNFFYQDWRLL